MSLIDKVIQNVEREVKPNFDIALKELDALSVDENERIARERYESGWKDELREMMQPFIDGVRKGESIQSLANLLGEVVATLTVKMAKDALIHHYFLKEIRLLQQERV